MQPAQENTRSYIVLRSFHLGEITQNLSVGDPLDFDGNTLTYKGKQYNCPTLSRAIQARLVVEDDGTYEVIRPVQAEKPKPKIVVENQEDMIVARVRLPVHEGITASKVVKTAEEVARTTGITANRKVIIEDQRIVGSAGMGPKPVKGPVQPLAQPDSAALQAQGGVVIKVKDKTMALLEAEGMVLKSGVTVITDQSGGTVIGKVKSQEQREAEHLQARREAAASSSSARVAMISGGANEGRTPEEDEAFKADLAKAMAKRNGTARPTPPPPPTRVDPKAEARAASTPSRPAPRTIKVAEVVDAEEEAAAQNVDSFPEGYPQFNRFPDRITWIGEQIALGEEGVEVAKTIYRLSNDKFKAHMAASFESIDFE